MLALVVAIKTAVVAAYQKTLVDSVLMPGHLERSLLNFLGHAVRQHWCNSGTRQMVASCQWVFANMVTWLLSVILRNLKILPITLRTLRLNGRLHVLLSWIIRV